MWNPFSKKEVIQLQAAVSDAEALAKKYQHDYHKAKSEARNLRGLADMGKKEDLQKQNVQMKAHIRKLEADLRTERERVRELELWKDASTQS